MFAYMLRNNGSCVVFEIDLSDNGVTSIFLLVIKDLF